MLRKYEVWFWFLLALAYYCFLSSFRYTWVFASGDAGDWLASAKMWFVPQPYGSPLYITLAKLTFNAFGLTLLSIIPASISVASIFQAVKNLRNVKLARISALIMLSSAIFMSQSVVIEEYALAVMFLCLTILAYSKNRFNLAVIFLGLGCAVHVIMLPIAFLFFVVHYKSWKYWIKKIPLFLLFGVVPYGLILVLMWADTPRWIANGLSLQSLNSWLGSTSSVGQLAFDMSFSPFRLPIETIQRIGSVIAFLACGVGLGIIPAVRYGMRHRHYPLSGFLVLTAIFAVWLYLTDTDWTTWTFCIYAIPCVAVLAAFGLRHSYKFERWLVIGVCCILLVVNGVFLNAKIIDKLNPVATTFYNETMALPDGSLVLTAKGGFYKLGLLHAIADGKDIIPIYLANDEEKTATAYISWLAWACPKYGLVGTDPVEIVENTTRPVYFVDVKWGYNDDWSLVYDFQQTGVYYKKVIAVK